MNKNIDVVWTDGSEETTLGSLSIPSSVPTNVNPVHLIEDIQDDLATVIEEIQAHLDNLQAQVALGNDEGGSKGRKEKASRTSSRLKIFGVDEETR